MYARFYGVLAVALALGCSSPARAQARRRGTRPSRRGRPPRSGTPRPNAAAPRRPPPAAFGAIIAERLYSELAEASEGTLTNMRAALVRQSSFAAWARELDLGAHIWLGRGEEQRGGRNRDSLLASCFEAVIGAIYLDQGLEAAKAFIVEHLIKPHQKLLATAQVTDHKSLLQEKWQKSHQLTPHYRIVNTFGPDHNKQFTIRVYLKGELQGEGKGKSKQAAQQQAAKAALEKGSSI